ncbi:MAG TPA: ATP-dependent DNA helicase [Actinomycetota bacterium]|nr:ATP-dependent DNA helicase [Actinomycetota bacterium]
MAALLRATAAIRAAMRGNEPTAEQWAAIRHPAEPLAIIAGAGSGKTAIMAARMVWMVHEGEVRPSRILGLTFTKKAAGELEQRIGAAFRELDPNLSELPLVTTYNAFADGIVREHGVRVGIDPESSLLTQAQTWQLLAESLDHIEPFEAIDSRSMSSLTRNALGLADQCANNYVTPDQVAAEDRAMIARGNLDGEVLLNARRRIELARVVKAYQQLKQQRRCMDFGDQVTKAVEILESWPAVAADLRQRFPAILLDEYQDTNVAQRRMMQALAPEGSNVTAVGDARQNIYQWRGSTLFNLIDFPRRHFLRASAAQHDYLSLSQNFRSGSRVVEAANAIIDRVLPERRPGLPLQAVEGNGDGFVGTALLADQRAEAEFVAREIARLHGAPASTGRPATEWRDFAILVRRKSHMTLIYSVLREQEIPVEVAGLGGLLQVPEVLDTVAWLRLIADPGPSGNRWLARILLGPRFRIHYRDLAILARWAAARSRELSDSKRATAPPADTIPIADETALEPDEVAFSLPEALDHLELIPELPPDVLERLLRMRRELQELRRHAGSSLVDLVQRVIAATGIGDALASSPRRDAAASEGNLRQFCNLAGNFAPISGEPSLAEFLEYLDAAEEAEDTLELPVSTAEDSVKLSTIHGAKGLEFEVVFVPGVAAAENRDGKKVYSIFPDERVSNPMRNYGLLPHGVREDAEHLPSPTTVDAWGNQVLKKPEAFREELKERAVEDERRLYYVALTRARQRLYVTAAWWYERQQRPHGKSLFFEELAGHPAVEDLGEAECPPESPLLAELEARAVWPPVVRNLFQATAVFPEGPVKALEDLLAGEQSAEDLLNALDAGTKLEAESLLDQYRKQIALLSAGRSPSEQPSFVPAGSLTASQAVDIAAGRLSPHLLARPLPQRPSREARIGVEVHRWIEERARGLTGLADEEALDAAASEVDAGRIAALKAAWDRDYGHRKLAVLPGGEPMAEVRFVLKVGDRVIRGRMDAVYESEDGGLEIVDFKTGARLEHPDYDQLAVYAGALRNLGIPVARTLRLTYAHLGKGTASTREMSPAEIDEALDRLGSRLSGVLGRVPR